MTDPISLSSASNTKWLAQDTQRQHWLLVKFESSPFGAVLGFLISAFFLCLFLSHTPPSRLDLMHASMYAAIKKERNRDRGSDSDMGRGGSVHRKKKHTHRSTGGGRDTEKGRTRKKPALDCCWGRRLYPSPVFFLFIGEGYSGARWLDKKDNTEKAWKGRARAEYADHVISLSTLDHCMKVWHLLWVIEEHMICFIKTALLIWGWPENRKYEQAWTVW